MKHDKFANFSIQQTEINCFAKPKQEHVKVRIRLIRLIQLNFKQSDIQNIRNIQKF